MRHRLFQAGLQARPDVRPLLTHVHKTPVYDDGMVNPSIKQSPNWMPMTKECFYDKDKIQVVKILDYDSFAV